MEGMELPSLPNSTTAPPRFPHFDSAFSLAGRGRGVSGIACGMEPAERSRVLFRANTSKN